MATLRTLRAITTSRTTFLAARTAPQSRALSTSQALRSASHGDHYDPPTGWLWGVPPGTKPEKEGWETIWVWGFFGSLGLGVVAYAYKPDTSIQTWALEEARRRLEAEGILTDPGLKKGDVKAQNTE
ncbi:hypothetical protein W97_00343 [Coniosporium apollinis CBS 100218]|uniref:NADH dehydrogenase [ubiquinone] 1 beta subcomplex subunit 11, mitochondrial n=1 Tax=Coniosporium apollinis (strain CBS 100218) TaxID=1168221 RepID=R7YGW0_CONA1|nr:uncharacterized protein W97_00343 [Coniosporium apollinis CBS 100218]EON61132.1 hypothetical protein W97_00343 [Coniosporium apollinis CBS 100218]